MADHVPSYVAYCGPKMETLEMIKNIFSTDYYIISLTNDVVGLECAVALKNAYALATALGVGIAEGHKED